MDSVLSAWLNTATPKTYVSDPFASKLRDDLGDQQEVGVLVVHRSCDLHELSAARLCDANVLFGIHVRFSDYQLRERFETDVARRGLLEERADEFDESCSNALAPSYASP